MWSCGDKGAVAGATNSTKSSTVTPHRRLRRKCSSVPCSNRAVQGGVCVAHGARRRTCSFPGGCDKAVKIAGRCSAHGPARRRCDYEGCVRVSVQGGKCLSHGARRKVCRFEGGGVCDKKVIVGGLCKKHHDQLNDNDDNVHVPLEPVGIGATGAVEVDVDGSDRDEWEPLQWEPQVELLPNISKPGMYCRPVVISTSTSSLSVLSSSTTTAEDSSAAGEDQLLEPPLTHQQQQPVPVPVPLPFPSSTSALHSSMSSSNSRHRRGLSIFDEMPTVDALISSTAVSKENLAPPALEVTLLPRQQLARPSVNSTAAASDLVGTPLMHVTYTASNVSNDNPASAAVNTMGTIMEDYYSPTLEILDQMQKEAEAEAEDDEYKYPGSGNPDFVPGGNFNGNTGPVFRMSPADKSATAGLARSVTFQSSCSLPSEERPCSYEDGPANGNVDRANNADANHRLCRQQGRGRLLPRGKPRVMSTVDLRHTVSNDSGTDENAENAENASSLETFYERMIIGGGGGGGGYDGPKPNDNRRLRPFAYDQPLLLKEGPIHDPAGVDVNVNVVDADVVVGEKHPRRQRHSRGDQLLPRPAGDSRGIFGNHFSP